MRPGAAVRLKGTWCNDGAQSRDAESIMQNEAAVDVSQDAAASTTATTTAELQVSEVEILGPSDPQVNYIICNIHSAVSVCVTKEKFPDTLP